MTSRCRTSLIAAALLLLASCSRGSGAAPTALNTTTSSASPPSVLVSAFVPGNDDPRTASDPKAEAMYDNPRAVADGMRLFGQYNCSGCHSNGGGGMGPALMDDEWIYGGRLEQIHQTLVYGRPNGMPAWGGKVPDDQLWEIAAYVRSMSLPETLAAQNGPTPSQRPAPVPRSVAQGAGWK